MTPVASWLQGLSRPSLPDEWEVKQLLARYDIPIPKSVRLLANAALPDLSFGEPYVVKVCSPDILHKTDRGGVKLNIRKETLAITVAEMRKLFPGEALLIEEQLKLSGSECIVGGLVDAEFGPAIMVGAGGILTELYKDVAFRLAPCTPQEAERMVEELKIAPLFEGFRGIRLDKKGLAAVLVASANLVADLGERFSQLDINPVGYAEGRFVALDGKLVLNPPA